MVTKVRLLSIPIPIPLSATQYGVEPFSLRGYVSIAMNLSTLVWVNVLLLKVILKSLSMEDVMPSVMLIIQVMAGRGFPSAVQFRAISSPSITKTSSTGLTKNSGGATERETHTQVYSADSGTNKGSTKLQASFYCMAVEFYMWSCMQLL